jgi:hypothetical protein
LRRQEAEVPPSQKRTEHSIAMWGAPSSGKTTFLAALSIALTRRGKDWKVVGSDKASADKLIALTTPLTREHAFPLATSGIEAFRWQLVGQVQRTIPRMFRTERYEETIRIGLDLADPSGEIAGPERTEGGERVELIDNLERSRGIVFLFDPIRESETGDTFDHTFGVLAQLTQRMIDSSEFADGWLPHYVAVCITKFDEIRVFKTAEKLNLLVADPADPLGLPRVADEDARELFAQLCDVSQSGNADMVLNTLTQHFRPERIKFFVTSAIGFYVDPRKGVYDPDDIQNLLPDTNNPKKPRIRGTVHPINVMEPLLWLGRQLAGVTGE